MMMVSEPFWLADREMPVVLFRRFMDDPDCPMEDKPDSWKGVNENRSPTENHPVQGVSWTDCVLFCNWLSRKERLTPAYRLSDSNWELIDTADGYRLPFEAEWERACRAGTTTNFACGNDDSLLSRYAVCLQNHTEPCGAKLPNGWGLFDMHGNVYEWCQNGDSNDRYLRGGAFDYESKYATSSIRAKNRSNYRSATIGMRLARPCR
jgi:formylglycine-generating enzyme